MKPLPVRFMLVTLLAGIAATSALATQGPRGVGGDIKPEKATRAKDAKPPKPTPIYSVPKSASWWSGGGPGPDGAGVK